MSRNLLRSPLSGSEQRASLITLLSGSLHYLLKEDIIGLSIPSHNPKHLISNWYMPLLITKCNYSWTDGKTVIKPYPRHILKSYSNLHLYTSCSDTLTVFKGLFWKRHEGCVQILYTVFESDCDGHSWTIWLLWQLFIACINTVWVRVELFLFIKCLHNDSRVRWQVQTAINRCTYCISYALLCLKQRTNESFDLMVALKEKSVDCSQSNYNSSWVGG